LLSRPPNKLIHHLINRRSQEKTALSVDLCECLRDGVFVIREIDTPGESEYRNRQAHVCTMFEGATDSCPFIFERIGRRYYLELRGTMYNEMAQRMQQSSTTVSVIPLRACTCPNFELTMSVATKMNGSSAERSSLIMVSGYTLLSSSEISKCRMFATRAGKR